MATKVFHAKSSPPYQGGVRGGLQCRGTRPPPSPLLRKEGVRRETLRQAPGPIGNQRGQALIEMGIIVVLFVILSMGIVEFGRAFMLANMVMHAARDGARAAAVIGGSGRDGDGMFTIDTGTSGPIGIQVTNQIKTILDAATVDTFGVQVVQTPLPPLNPGDIPVVTLAIAGQIPYIFNLVGAQSFGINRQVTFRDEGRNAP